MKYATTGAGTAMRTEHIRTRFATGVKAGPRQDHKLSSRVTEIRKLLRTSLSIEEIANELGVARQTLAGFIKRRQLCNMAERSNFITLKRSLAREDEPEVRK